MTSPCALSYSEPYRQQRPRYTLEELPEYFDVLYQAERADNTTIFLIQDNSRLEANIYEIEIVEKVCVSPTSS